LSIFDWLVFLLWLLPFFPIGRHYFGYVSINNILINKYI
jgi:hypothetical protein